MKALSTLLSLFLFSFWANAQAPVNDDCGGIVNLGVVPYCSGPGQYTNVNATTSVIDVPSANVPSCFNNDAERDVWFRFDLPANGSIVNIEISVFGDVGGNGSMKMPQVALYRGDCLFGELAELDCAAAPLNVNEVRLTALNLTPGFTYFLRINDYSATATPNAGTFKLCVEEYVPEIIMGDEASTESCTGTLWDSGGPSGDYDLNEDLTFTICPQDFHQCIIINVEDYEVEQGYDYLSFYQGADIASGIQLTQLTGFGSNFQVQVPAPCATIRFTSDISEVFAGFKITWSCSANACTTPPVTTCADPDVIANLPFSENGLSNCFSGNTIQSGPCDDADFLEGNDYIFSYTSPGDECIRIATSGTGGGAGIGVYSQCPSSPNADCIAVAGGDIFTPDPVVSAAFLENPGTYYIVFGAGLDCSPFNITVDTVTCPVILPSASTCDKALNIGGCSNLLPQIIALNPGAGDPDFLVDDVNKGCFVDPQQNFAFFYFTAGANGKFGFTVQSADPDEASDIDFNVWGPINNVADICNFTSNNQPVRSSWAVGADPTGLADIHPVDGSDVTDEFDCGDPSTPSADGDDFVRRLDVIEGKIYVILLDDYGNAIVEGGISIDFSSTTDGVLNALDSEVTVSADTAVCSGQPVQLNATGGAAYSWSPNVGLSCSNCPNPIATPLQTTTYQVEVVSTCDVTTRSVDIKIINLSLGPDVTVCNNASFTLNPNGFPDAQYTWTGPAGLSCYNCPSPIVSGLTTGVYTFIAKLQTPQCTKSDTIKVTVVSGQQPQYNISDDKTICAGETVSLGGASFPSTFYQWSSDPLGFSSTNPNPSVTPLATTQYFIVAFNVTCPVVAIDSVLITVVQPSQLLVQGDTAICNGESVLLGNTVPEAGVMYVWTPNNGTLNNPAIANPLASPLGTTTYLLTATKDVCVRTKTVQISVVNLNLALSVADTVPICKGTSVPIQALVNPLGGTVEWSPLTGLQILSPDGVNVVATPSEPTLYTAKITLPGCIRTQTVFVQVDSLPQDLAIMPMLDTICQGEKVTLKSTIYDPAEYPNIQFQWIPLDGQLTPDSLFNMVVQPDDTTLYKRITTNGACVQIDSALILVNKPPEFRIEPTSATLCPGQSVQLMAIYSLGVTNTMWSPPNGLSCTQCDNPVASPGSTTTYTFKGDYGMCPVSASVTVTVIDLPIIQFPTDLQLCKGESILLNQAFDPTATYNWTSNDPNFIPTNNPQPVATPTQTATYFVTANNGCSNQGQVTVVVSSATLVVSNGATICKNASALLTASGSLPGTYQWSDGQTGQAVNVSPATTTTYTVTYTYGDNCQIVDQVTVTVLGEAPNIVPSSDLELCPGENTLLNTLNTPGAVYTWSSDPPGFSSNQAIPPPVSPTQSTQYTVTATLGNCTTVGVMVVVVYNATLTLPADFILCRGEVAEITAVGSATGTYDWSTGATTSSIEVSPQSTTTYDLVYTYGDDCVLEDEVTVTVKDNFTLSVTVDPDTNRINVGESLTLMAVVSPSQNLTNFQFQWQENGTVNVGNTETIVVTPSSNDTSIFYLITATSPNGCVQDTIIRFRLLQPLVVVPTAFTPNDDGVNDVFRLKVLEGSAIIEQMEIYNRWGQKVFSSTEADAAWDGKTDGKEAPSDVYVYVIRWRRSDGALQPPKQGDVTLLR